MQMLQNSCEYALKSISSMQVSQEDRLRFIHSFFFTVHTGESDVTAFSGPRTVTEPEAWLSIKYLDTQHIANGQTRFFSSVGLYTALAEPVNPPQSHSTTILPAYGIVKCTSNCQKWIAVSYSRQASCHISSLVLEIDN